MHAVRLSVVLATIALIALLAGVLAPHAAAQQSTPLTVEITSTDATQLPTTILTANVYTAVGTPLTGLTIDNFSLRGALADAGGSITSVQNVSADAIPFSVVLVIDTSSSMYGTPLQRAKDAAREFVDSLRADDQVALIAFNSDVSLVQDFTADKASVGAAIDTLVSTGRTALYDAADAAIAAAQRAPTQRRVVVFLSDGQEDRGSETATRFTSLQNARSTGIPVYTIGFGSVDQDYMRRFADGSGAQFFLAPSPEQLGDIYTSLSNALRSQYIITLNTPLANDGTEYPYELVVTYGEMSGSVEGSLRAPIPVPVVRLPDAPVDPIREPVTLTAQILADDPITSFSYQIGDAEPQTIDGEPYDIVIDPNVLPPGDLTLSISATDNTGDTGTAALPLTIAALPPTINLEPDPATLNVISEPVILRASVGGQTPVTSIGYLFDDGGNIGVDPELSSGVEIRIDPRSFMPGPHTLTIMSSNEGGQRDEKTYNFEIAQLPPLVSVTGLVEGQQIDAPTTFEVDVTGQSLGDIESVTVEVVQGTSRKDIPSETSNFNPRIIDPMDFVPGSAEVVMTGTAVGGTSTTITVPVIIGALPPVIHLDGLHEGDTLEADRQVSATFDSQTPINHLAVFVDGVDLAHLVSEPFTFTLQVLAYAPGDHDLRVIATNTSGQSIRLDLGFSISSAPAASATQAAQQSAATQTQSAASLLGTQSAALTGTAVSVASQTFAAQQAATSTADEVARLQTSTRSAAEQTAAARTATQEAQNAAATQSILNATATRDAQNAAATQAIVNRTATAEQIAASTAQAQTATQSAAQDSATRTAVAATSTALFNAVSTVQAQTATQSAIDALATQAAVSATATARAALDALNTRAAATAMRQATIDAAQGTILARQATQSAATESAAEIQRMEDARTATANSILAGTAGARTATVQARTAAAATLNATAEVTVEATATDTPPPPRQITVEVTPDLTSESVEETPDVMLTAQPQGAPTATPTLTPIEISQQEPPVGPQSLPLVLVGLGILVILAVVVYLILTSRRPKNRR
ncbi:MAG: VWA domain-containing protein [Anaerolineae bacterium]